MDELTALVRIVCFSLAALGVIQCALLVAVLLTVRRRELRLVRAIRRKWRLNMEAAALSALDQDRRSRLVEQFQDMVEAYRLDGAPNALPDSASARIERPASAATLKREAPMALPAIQY
jgi:biopolymer transport protein ExbB/TolQ